MKVTFGKNTLGGGEKITAETPHYNRSTHDQSYIWRNTMAAGTLVPFLCEVALRGDTHDIDLECEVLTQPTIGPLFGSMKVQMDIFSADVRLYQGKLHNNALNVGMKMNTIKLPIISIQADNPDWKKGNVDNEQINPSCILKYLGISGLGYSQEPDTPITRQFNAIAFIAYWDIYKNYYANKQEEIGAVIHGEDIVRTITGIIFNPGTTDPDIPIPENTGNAGAIIARGVQLGIGYVGDRPDPSTIILVLESGENKAATDIFQGSIDTFGAITLTTSERIYSGEKIKYWKYAAVNSARPPKITTFPLENLDKMREDIIYHNSATAFVIGQNTYAPYGLPLKKEGNQWSKLTSQEGLAIKTYQSDIFNNWIQTEWVDGDNGINAITAIDTSEGEFTIDTLIMARKVYNMLNAVAMSGGTYYDWMNVNWEEEQRRPVMTPIYHGGLSKELVFQEVISTASAIEGQQPLGTLGGRGKLSGKHKGGKVRIKTDETSYIMGIISITPRIDYCQGNRYDVNIFTMDDFHKPALDNIGFEDAITDKFAWWDTYIDETGKIVFRSAGKQPAWINYMTNYNRTYGNFADQTNQGWMVLNRNYQPDPTGRTIKDLTTYIDPMLYNNVFAETARDAMNYWVQIGVNITSRKLMSAKMMPNG